MFRDRAAERKTNLLLLTAGATVGIAAGLILVRRGWRLRQVLPGLSLSILERQVREALRADGVLRRREIEAGALADGIVELSGTVRDDMEAQRAVALARRVPGVRTVLNRLDLEILEEHLSDTRRRFDEGDPRLHETQWNGLRVGTGRRRQGRETEPDRPDDRVPIVSRELGADRAVEQTSERLDKIPNGVEGHTTLPAAPSDRGLAQRAPHRRLGNVPEEPLQDLNPASGIHENVPLGTEVTLEETGAEQELIERHLEDRS